MYRLFPTFHVVLPGPYSIYTQYAPVKEEEIYEHIKAPLLVSSPHYDKVLRDPRSILSLAVARQHVRLMCVSTIIKSELWHMAKANHLMALSRPFHEVCHNDLHTNRTQRPWHGLRIRELAN